MKAEINKKAMSLIKNSKMPIAYIDAFGSLYDQSKQTNSEDTKFSLKWHDDKTDPETFCPVLTFRMAKKRVLDAEEKKARAKMKKNPKKQFIASTKEYNK